MRLARQVIEQSRCHAMGEAGRFLPAGSRASGRLNGGRERRLCKTLHKFTRDVGRERGGDSRRVELLLH